MIDLKYSIIVPIYGVEQYINQCIESIINQTYKNIEIILVDDGSKDNCPNICDEYAKIDSRISVVHKENGGLVSARKAGAELATGDYVCCVDGDDYIDLNYIEEINKITQNQLFDIVCCGYHQTMPNKTIDVMVNAEVGAYDKKCLQEKIYPNLILNSRGSYFLPTVWAKAIKRDLYKFYQMQVPNEVSMGEDGACTVPCIAHANSMYISEKCLYYYRFNPSSMTKSKKALKWEGQLYIANHLRNMLDLSIADFQEQYYRRVEKGFFTVAKSQFNRNEAYQIIKDEILMMYDQKVFLEAIENAKYKGSKMTVIDFFVKNKIFLGLWLLNYIS